MIVVDKISSLLTVFSVVLKRRVAACLFIFGLFSCHASLAAPLKSHIDSLSELEYGVVLYDYFQEDYFAALIEYEYSYALKNEMAVAPTGRVLKGGMMLSYGMPEESQKLFSVLLDKTSSQDVSNRAWYYLSKIYYNKSEVENANSALKKVTGDIPEDIFFNYYYLSTLIGNQQPIETLSPSVKGELSNSLPGYPYLLFNLGIGHLRSGDIPQAVEYLNKVSQYTDYGEELTVLADRAKNGLAQLALESGRLSDAWTHLTKIRTTGLYSNRALLAYAWSAIKGKQFNQAIPALKTLNDRSISIPEVQETKVLLPHLYEQQGQFRKALQSNIAAEKEFEIGIAQVNEARNIIKGLDVPRQFIGNLESIMQKSDWYASTPSIDYQKLTPFLIDLMASNAFTEVLKELADLYSIRDNLNYWIGRSDEHSVILESAKQKNFNQELSRYFEKSAQLNSQLADKKAELQLYTLTLDEKDQDRMIALLDTTKKEFDFLDSKIAQLIKLDSAYKQPDHFQGMVSGHHRRLQQQLEKTERYIDGLEPIMRRLVNLELDKHEKRMRYYWAQSRLAKARLYDNELLSLEKGPEISRLSDQTTNGVKK
ncbi:MAG: tetratricopeptide repeat protein [Cellvibrionaceae bacterium]